MLVTCMQHGVRRQLEMDTLEVSKESGHDRMHRVDEMVQWANRLSRPRDKHRAKGIASNLASSVGGSLTGIGKAVASTAVGAAHAAVDVSRGLAGAGPRRRGAEAPEGGGDGPRVEHPNGPDLLAALEAAFNITDVDGVCVLQSCVIPCLFLLFNRTSSPFV
jgi:hypothetical protein